MEGTFEQIIKDTSLTGANAFLKNNVIDESNPIPVWDTDLEAFIFTDETTFDMTIDFLENHYSRTTFVGQNPPIR